jgi:hypothetical protein
MGGYWVAAAGGAVLLAAAAVRAWGLPSSALPPPATARAPAPASS